MQQFQKDVRKHDQLKEEKSGQKERKSIQSDEKKKKNKTNPQNVTNLKYYIM